MTRRKKRLTRQDLRDLGATPGRLLTRLSPDGRKATVRQVVGEAQRTGAYRIYPKSPPLEGGSKEHDAAP